MTALLSSLRCIFQQNYTGKHILFLNLTNILYSMEDCRASLVQFGVREITPASIARVLGMMARTPSGLPDQGQSHSQVKSLTFCISL